MNLSPVAPTAFTAVRPLRGTRWAFALAAAVALGPLAATAAEPAPAAPAPATSLSRAEVRAELLRARAAGELPSPADLYGPTLRQAMQAAPSRPTTAAAAPRSQADTPQASGTPGLAPVADARALLPR